MALSRGKRMLEMALKNQMIQRAKDEAPVTNDQPIQVNPGHVTPSVAAIFESMQVGVEEPDVADTLFEFETELSQVCTGEAEMLDGSFLTELSFEIPAVGTILEDELQAPLDIEISVPTAEQMIAEVEVRTEQSAEPLAWQACKLSCKRKCSEKIHDNQRTSIWRQFQELSYNEKRQMIFKHVSRTPKRRLTAGEHKSRRDMSFQYKFKGADGTDLQVCKTFFLKTLGYNEKNDRLVSTVMKTTPSTDLTAKGDRRGRHPSTQKIDRTPIADHINSFKPTISHYRREHAPYRKYLPSDITIQLMYSDFKEKYPDVKCGLETYRKTVSVMNISFAKLGEEECEKCEAHIVHLKTDDHHSGSDADEKANDQVNCTDCNEWKIHNHRARLSRAKYQDDSGKDWPVDFVVKSADLQKVIMLPRMPGNKTAIFIRRIIAFHETFATLGRKLKGKKKENSTSIVWHEGIAGRKAEEITSAFIAALEKDRDKKHVILWLDNCSAQNKNWCLLTSLVCLVNSETVEFEDITLKFFEAGHTFMSADAFHHGVELEMKNRSGGKVYDFPEFIDVVKKSNSGKVDVIVMENEKVCAYKSGQSQAKLKKASVLLARLSVIQLKRGSRNLFVKTKHDDENFREIDFLRTKFRLEMPSKLRTHGRGVPGAKKAAIMQKLCPLMPASRRSFWENLIVDDSVDTEALSD